MFAPNIHYPRKPEILIVICPPKTHSGSQTFRTIFLTSASGGQDFNWRNGQGTVRPDWSYPVTGETWTTKIGHVVACICALDGNINLVNNDIVTNWGLLGQTSKQ